MSGYAGGLGEVFPNAKYQRCVMHFYRNVFSVVPKSKVKLAAKMLKAIHAQESKKAAREKAAAVVVELREMKLRVAAKKIEAGVEETLTYADFPFQHWTRIRTNGGRLQELLCCGLTTFSQSLQTNLRIILDTTLYCMAFAFLYPTYIA